MAGIDKRFYAGRHNAHPRFVVFYFFGNANQHEFFRLLPGSLFVIPELGSGWLYVRLTTGLHGGLPRRRWYEASAWAVPCTSGDKQIFVLRLRTAKDIMAGPRIYAHFTTAIIPLRSRSRHGNKIEIKVDWCSDRVEIGFKPALAGENKFFAQASSFPKNEKSSET